MFERVGGFHGRLPHSLIHIWTILYWMSSVFRMYEKNNLREYFLSLNSVPFLHISYENIKIKTGKTIL
jgi:hypothetical protein